MALSHRDSQFEILSPAEGCFSDWRPAKIDLYLSAKGVDVHTELLGIPWNRVSSIVSQRWQMTFSMPQD